MFDFLSEKFSAVFSRLTGNDRLTENNISQSVEQVRESLLQADVPLEVVEAFTQQIKQEVLGKKVVSSLKPAEYFIKIVHDTLVQFLGGVQTQEPQSGIWMVMGLQGSGKTTSLAKIAHYLKIKAGNKAIRIGSASVDFYRPAAREQLAVLAQANGFEYYHTKSLTARDAVNECKQHIQSNRYDYFLLDTAGRLHVDQTMLQELVDIEQIIKPSYKLLVLDAMTGQESLAVARSFDQKVKFDGALLTKMDSDTRAGAAFAFCYSIKKPIVWLGTGEKAQDLQPFKADRMAQRILGMGDIQSLLERADTVIKQEEQERVAKRMMSGAMTLQDFADQLGMMQKLGSLTQLAQYIPGMGNLKVSKDQLVQGEVELKKFKAALSSMTRKERSNHKILNGQRKIRIARGAGIRVEDIDRLLARFEQSQHFVKMMKRFGSF